MFVQFSTFVLTFDKSCWAIIIYYILYFYFLDFIFLHFCTFYCAVFLNNRVPVLSYSMTCLYIWYHIVWHIYINRYSCQHLKFQEDPITCLSSICCQPWENLNQWFNKWGICTCAVFVILPLNERKPIDRSIFQRFNPSLVYCSSYVL